MAKRRTAIRIYLSREERHELEEWTRSTKLPSGLARRGRLILMMADGNGSQDVGVVAHTIGISRQHLYKWVKRFQTHRLAGLPDKSGRGRKPKKIIDGDKE